MEEIDIREVLDFYKSKVLIIVLVTCLFLLGGNLYSKFIKVPVYESSTKIVLVSSSGKTTTNNDVKLNQDLIGDYTVVAKSNTTLNTVLANLDLTKKYSIKDLSNMVTVSSTEGSNVINLKVTSTDAKEAAYLVNELSEVFAKVVNDIYSLDNVYILDRGNVSKHASNDNLVKENMIYFLAGFVLSVGVLFVIFYFDDSIKNSDEIEKKYNVVVIGNVPMEGGNK